MAIEDGKDCRNWLNHPEEHMAIKEKRRMLRFQVRVFKRELKAEQKKYDTLLAKTADREKSYKPMFDSLEKLNDAYVVGKVDDRTYMSQRSKIWQVYSDRGHIANLAWLQSELDYYQGKLDALEGKMDDLRKLQVKDYPSTIRRKNASHKRKVRRKIRRQELQERWRKYGIG